MNKHEDMDFVFGSHEEDNNLRDEAIYGNIDKLSHRLTLFAVIVPCIIGMVLVFGYFDIKSRMDKVSDTGTREVKNVSQDMERMLSQLQVRHAKLEKRVNEELTGINNSISSVNKKIRRARKDIDFLAASRATKKSLKPRFDELKSSLATMGEDLRLISAKADALKTDLAQSEIKRKKSQTDNAKARKTFESRLENKLESELDRKGTLIAQSLKKIEALEKSVALARKEGLSTNTLDIALKKERVIYNVKLEQLKEELKSEIDRLKFAATDKKEPKPAPPSNDIIEQDLTD